MGTHRQAHRRTIAASCAVLAVVASAALLVACLTPGFGSRLVDPADGDRHAASITQVVGDDVGPAVLPTAVALVVLATVAAVLQRAPRSQRVELVVSRRDRAPPSGIDC